MRQFIFVLCVMALVFFTVNDAESIDPTNAAEEMLLATYDGMSFHIFAGYSAVWDSIVVSTADETFTLDFSRMDARGCFQRNIKAKSSGLSHLTYYGTDINLFSRTEQDTFGYRLPAGEDWDEVPFTGANLDSIKWKDLSGATNTVELIFEGNCPDNE